MAATFPWLCRSFSATAYSSVTLLLLSCSGSTPVSPSGERSATDGQDGLSLASGSIVDLRVGDNGWLRRDGSVAVRVRAFCRTGYEVAESGPLALTQRQGRREAYGEGFLQHHLGGCTGEWEARRVLVQQYEEPIFRRGRARVSVTFSVVRSSDPEGDPHQVSVLKYIRIRVAH